MDSTYRLRREFRQAEMKRLKRFFTSTVAPRRLYDLRICEMLNKAPREYQFHWTNNNSNTPRPAC